MERQLDTFSLSGLEKEMRKSLTAQYQPITNARIHTLIYIKDTLNWEAYDFIIA